ncbi:unnamed protein product [Haemonchus placei]|uniref:Uncharacterized protein n=1 Tax=Haemonchus placei TaxID=6290 RepID=A0A3P7XTZ1_HAEPC|nr:unnamed protein product [Haemonchus placei]
MIVRYLAPLPQHCTILLPLMPKICSKRNIQPSSLIWIESEIRSSVKNLKSTELRSAHSV